MKITQSQLRQIIREEASRVLREPKDFGITDAHGTPAEQDALAIDLANAVKRDEAKREEFTKHLESAVNFGLRSLNRGLFGGSDSKGHALINLLLTAGRAFVAADDNNDVELYAEIMKIKEFTNKLPRLK